MTSLALLALAGAVGTGAASTEIALPAADVILDGYIEATGGKAAHGKVINRVTKASMDIAAQGITLDLTSYSARPNRKYSLIESDVFGKIEKGTDGTTVWEISAMMGPQIKEGQEKTDFLREAMFDRMIMWRDVYKKAECVGIETVSDKPAYKVVLTPEGGKPQTLYFDQASKLLVKLDITAETSMGVFPAETFFEDYREVGGILHPFRTRIVTMGQERVLTIDSIEQNVDLPSDRFDLPEEIRALLEDKKEETATSPKG
ncbi:MAG: LolA-like protein [Planctomycetota bacterium]